MPETSKRILATVMFTDMVGYTALMQTDEVLARQKRDRHREVFEQLHEAFNGEIIQYFGDGTLSIFQNVLHAVQCAVELQLRLKEPIEVPLRIGLHLGEVLLEKDQLIGDAVNIASRVESFAATGSVLVSREIVTQLSNQSQFSFQSMGTFQFKNVQKAKELFAVQYEGLVVPVPEELSGKGKRERAEHNLPRMLTSFVGRQKEIGEVTALIRKNALVTLTGPGGSGKTRLSLEVAKQLLYDFQNGVRWVSLSSVLDADMVGFAISEGLGLKPSIRDVEDLLVQYLADKEMLLLLDNFEQIIEASSLIDELLSNCPGIKIMVTSRIVLNIFGEVEYPVEPLPLPKRIEINNLKVLKDNPAIDLFCQRAEKTRRRFELTAQNAKYVAEICRRLDGLPLALELAAARTKIFSPDTLLERLSQSLDILKTRNRQMPERHQTLRQTIAWSYDLLEQEEQELLCRFSVFVGGSDLEAIDAVCVQNGLTDWDFEEGIENLVDKSLIKIEETASRFYMLETIREFASDQLKQSVKDQVYKLAHIKYYLQLAERASGNLNSINEELKKWASILYQELPNLKAAIDYAIELKEWKLAYQLSLALRPFWSNQGSVNEGIQILNKILAVPVSEHLKEDWIQVKQSFAVMHFYFGVFKGLEDIFKECLAFWTKQGDDPKIAETLNHLIFVQANTGKLAEAEKNYRQISKLAEKLGNQSFSMRVLNNLGYLHLSKGNPDEALAAFEKILPIARELGDERWIGYTYSNMSIPLIFKAEYQKAIDLLMLAQKRHREAREIMLLQHALHQSSQAYFELGEYRKCEALIKEANEWNQISHSEVSMILLTDSEARIALKRNQLEEAEAIIERYIQVISKKEPSLRWQMNAFRTKCLTSFAQKRYEEVKTFTLELFMLDKSQTSCLTLIPAIEFSARLALIEKNYDLAAKLFHKAQQLRVISSMPVPRSEEEDCRDLEEELEKQLGENKFRQRKLEGQNLSLKEAIHLSKELLL